LLDVTLVLAMDVLLVDQRDPLPELVLLNHSGIWADCLSLKSTFTKNIQ